jgi:hypothetical protein
MLLNLKFCSIQNRISSLIYSKPELKKKISYFPDRAILYKLKIISFITKLEKTDSTKDFEYVKLNVWNKSCESDSSNKQGMHVLKGNHLFNRHRVNAESICWKCVHAKKATKCKATIAISGDGHQCRSTAHWDLEDKEVTVQNQKQTFSGFMKAPLTVIAINMKIFYLFAIKASD